MKSSDNSEIEYEIKPAGKFSLNTKELWQYKELFYFFTWRDIKVKYKQTVLGFAWAILQPALLMLIFTFLFAPAIGAEGKVSIPYPVFVYTGLILWGIFSGGLQAAGNSMVNNSNIIKKIYFPRLIIPLSSILVSVFDFLMTLIPYALLLWYYKMDIHWVKFLIQFPLSLLIILGTTFGGGCLLSALNVKYRDFRYVLPFLIQFLMFVTPVIYPSNVVSNPYIQTLLKINPLSIAIELIRGIYSSSPTDYYLVGLGLCFSLLFFLTGIYYFRKMESYFADLA